MPSNADDRSSAIGQDIESWNVSRIFTDPEGALQASREQLAASSDGVSANTIAFSHLVAGSAQAFLGNAELAQENLEIARDQFIAGRDPRGELTAILRLNIVWEMQSQLQHALAQLPEAIARVRTLDDPQLLIGYLNDYGVLLRQNREFDAGYDALSEAWQLAENVNDPFHILLTKSNLVSSLLLQYDFETAAAFCQDCLDLIAERPELSAFERMIHFKRAECAVELRDYTGAVEEFRTAHEQCEHHTDLYFSARSLSAGAHASYLAGDIPGAISSFRHSIDKWNSMSTVLQPAESSMSQWWIEHLTESWSWGTVEELRAILERRDAEPREMCIRIFEALAESTEQLGDFQACVGYLRQVTDFKESFWRDVAVGRSHLAARAHQTAAAQRTAKREREQREQIDLAMTRVIRLNEENEVLVAELTSQSQILAQLAREDPLTELGNRRHFDEHLLQELIRTDRFGHPLSVALLDVDDLKSINDSWSRTVGDQVLKLIGRIIGESCRVTDIAARYGGDEFALILPETDATTAAGIARNLHNLIGVAS